MKPRDWAVLALAAVAAGALTRPETGRAPAPPEADRRSLAAAAKPRSGGFLASIVREAADDRLVSVAASVAFYALLALVPALAVAVSLYGLFGDPARLATVPDALRSVLPGEAVGLVQDQAARLASESSRALSMKLVIGLAVSLWGASSAVKAVFDALNVIAETTETRSFFWLSATALVVAIAGILVLLAAVAVIGASPHFLALGPFSAGAVALFALLRWPIFMVVAIGAIATLYWIGPSQRPRRFRAGLPGAAAAALMWAIVSAGFSWYVTAIGSYSATYGSLTAVVVFLTWLWLSSVVVLVGAQVNLEIERRAQRI
jgi:membrane protein